MVSRYPTFNAENEARLVLEGRALLAALEARSDSEARALMLEYAAAREQRARLLGSAELVEFEPMTEMIEGLAEDAQILGLEFVGKLLFWSFALGLAAYTALLLAF